MKTIKILGYNYEIKNQPPAEDGGTQEAGRIFTGKHVIIIDPNGCQQAQESTLLHEILEALNYYFDLEIDHRAIMSLEAGLFTVLTDNGVNLSVLLKNEVKNANQTEENKRWLSCDSRRKSIS